MPEATDAQAGGAPSLGNVGESVAISLLEDLHTSKKLSDEQYSEFRRYYEELHQLVVEKHEKERALLKLARRRQNDVLGEKIKLERSIEKLEAEEKELEILEADREKVQKLLDEAEQKDTVTKYELAELQRTHSEMLLHKDELKQENEALVLPELRQLESEVEKLKSDVSRQEEAHSKETQHKQNLVEKHQSMEHDLEEAQKELTEAKERLLKAQVEPERIRKQAESVARAAETLEKEITQLTDKIAAADAQIERQAQKKKETAEVKAALARKLELHQSTIEHRQVDVDALQRNLDQEKAIQHDLATTRVELELKKKGLDEQLRRELDSLNMHRKEYDQLKRKLRKKEHIANAAREVIPTLEAQLVDAEHSLRIFREDNRKLEKEVEVSKSEVDVYIARFMKQEITEQAKREGLEQLLQQVATQESELQQWQAEERRQNKLIALLTAQRELKAREASKAAKLEKETRQALKVKELSILDLTKKCNEVNNRLKEFSALYDVVKNERNKYVNLIQASSQGLAEMKEKIRILHNEVEILRNESLAKDKALAKEVASHAISKNQRDSLRLDLNKSQQDYRRKQDVVQQQIEEVKTLNSIINGLEKEMLRLKKHFEEAVEKRNETGVALIDRNDELCILYEKANLQEATLKRGEVAVKQREDEVRSLKLEMAELERQLAVSMKKMPGVPDLEEKAKKLQEQLQDQRSQTQLLCKDLEDPSNKERYRQLEGEDPDLEQLSAKVSVLEARLDQKKEQLLEKELVLEEVSNLTQKLKNKAGDGRDATLKLAQKANEFQARIRDVTRRMMATVSELSMYQATAMKLQQEKSASQEELEGMKWRIAHGQPPTEDAEREWMRREQQRIDRIEAKHASLAAAQDAANAPAGAIRTTAEPRPNAYIPDDLGIPKPYGGLAPFKPSDPGTTMRHIRPPNPAEIQI